MHMIVHQAIRPYLDAIFITISFKGIQVVPAIRVIKENLLAPASSLNNMMRTTFNNNPKTTRHKTSPKIAPGEAKRMLLRRFC